MILQILQENIWVILVAAGLLLVLLAVAMRGRKPRPPAVLPTLTPHEQIERQAQSRGMKSDLEELMVEIERMANRVGAQLDAKAGEMEKLLEEARQKIAQLERVMAEAVPREAMAEPEVPKEIPAGQEPDDPLSRSVYRLADAGHASEQIASKLNEHVGKVELILALRDA